MIVVDGVFLFYDTIQFSLSDSTSLLSFKPLESGSQEYRFQLVATHKSSKESPNVPIWLNLSLGCKDSILLIRKTRARPRVLQKYMYPTYGNKMCQFLTERHYRTIDLFHDALELHRINVPCPLQCYIALP